MARYFFDCRHGGLWLHDGEGDECHDRHAALKRSGQILLEIAADVPQDAACAPMSMSVRDEMDRAVGEVALSLAVEWIGVSDGLSQFDTPSEEVAAPGHSVCWPVGVITLH